MLVFATEFPASPEKNLTDLLEVACNWVVGGGNYIGIPRNDFFIPEDDIWETVTNGQKISLGRFRETKKEFGGLRYYWVENDERAWTTEILGSYSDSNLWISITLDCEVFNTGALAPIPKKPHVIKQIFSDIGGGFDGELKTSDCPHFLKDSDSDLRLVKEIILGSSRCQLPVVYVSVDFSGYPSIDYDNTARWLSGVAHVLVEPSRSFSKEVGKLVNGMNAYGGAVGIYWPRRAGKHQRLFLEDYLTAKDLVLEVQSRIWAAWLYAKTDRTLNWADIQGLVSNKKLNDLRLHSDSSIKDYISAFDSENDALKAKLNNLEAKNEMLRQALDSALNRASSAPGLLAFGSEQDFFKDEIKDLVISVLTESLKNTIEGSRREIVLTDIINSNKPSGLVDEISKQIKLALEGKNKIQAAEIRELEKIGFSVSSDGSHHKAIFRDDPRFTFTIPKTPSDHRSMKNLISEIIRKLFK